MCELTLLFLSSLSSLRSSVQQFCCDSSYSIGSSSSSSSTSSIPAYVGPVGNQPTCPICGTSEYPGIPFAFVVARYVGSYTCEQLYGRGLHGMIPDFMCGPLQDFAKPICGCGSYNPNYSGSSPAAAPHYVTSNSLTAAPANSNYGFRALRGSDKEEEVPPPESRQLTEGDVDMTVAAFKAEEAELETEAEAETVAAR